MSEYLKPIGELVQTVAKWNPSLDQPDSYFMYVDIGSVDSSSKSIVLPEPILRAEAPSRARQLIQSNDVLVSNVRPNLNAVAHVDGDIEGLTASTGFTVLRPKPELLDSRYLFHWVQNPSFIGIMVAQATGASYPAVSDKIVKASLLPTPPLEEQRRIAAILDKADALRRKRQKSLALMDEFLRSVFLEMFGDPVIPSTEHDTMPLSKCGEWISGGTPTKSNPDYWGGDIPWISAKSLTSLLLKDSSDKVTPLVAENGTRITPAGSILFIVRGMSLANEFKVGLSTKDVTFNQDTKAIRPNTELVMPEYLLMALKLSEKKILSLVDTASHGTKKLNTRDIGSLTIPMVPFGKQQKFSEIFYRMTRQKDDMSEMLLEQNKMFEALTQCAFRGDLTGDLSC
jgi:type I restriction enzyme S subunit